METDVLLLPLYIKYNLIYVLQVYKEKTSLEAETDLKKNVKNPLSGTVNS